MSTDAKRSVLWQGVYKTTKVRIVEVVHPDSTVNVDGVDVTFPGLVSRLVEMSTAQDVMGVDIWGLTEFDADMLLYFLLSHPTAVKPMTGELGLAATVAANAITSSAMVQPEA